MSDIFNKILGNLQDGKNTDFVIEEDIKKNKKKKNKNISNLNLKEDGKVDQDGVHIIHNDVASRVRYSIKSRTYRSEDRINEWTTRDFVLYMRGLYYNKYYEDWGLQIPRACMDFKCIEGALEDMFNMANPSFVKKYVDFFFEKWIDVFMGRCQSFFLSFLERKEVLIAYHNHLESLRDNSLDMEGKIKVELKDQKLSNELIEASCSMGYDNLVYDYGIILSINWLLLYKKIDKKEVSNKILEICKEAYGDKKFGIIEKKTEYFSPYPEWFIAKKIGPKVKANIIFEDSEDINNKYNFMRNAN